MPTTPRSLYVSYEAEKNVTITMLGTKDMSRMVENIPIFR